MPKLHYNNSIAIDGTARGAEVTQLRMRTPQLRRDQSHRVDIRDIQHQYFGLIAAPAYGHGSWWTLVSVRASSVTYASVEAGAKRRPLRFATLTAKRLATHAQSSSAAPQGLVTVPGYNEHCASYELA
jgi:hypothetical protein